ncbi:MAG: hypothetical protein AAF768_00010 [Pseudomonadota bacterium]
MKHLLSLLLWPMLSLHFVSGLTAFADEAPPTFILVDHSDTMAEQLDQEEAWGDISHYVNNLDTDDLVSITYFGGENGGDCQSAVAINDVVPKSSFELQPTRLSAFGDNPMLGAIESIVAERGNENTRLVIISDFDAACGVAESACFAVQKYKEEYPRLDFEFEPVGDYASKTVLYRCLAAIQPVKQPFQLPRIAIDLNLTTREQIGPLDPPETHWMSNFGWAVYLILVGLVLLTAALRIMRIQYATDAYGEAAKKEVKVGAISKQEERLQKRTQNSFYATCFIMVVFSSLWFCPLADMNRILGLILNWLEGRFGSAIASTTLGGYVAWFALSYWKGGMERLKVDWQEGQKAIKVQDEIETLESSHEDELSSITQSFESYSGRLSAEDYSAGELLLADMRIAFESLLKTASDALQERGPSKWKRRGFKQADKIIDRLEQHYGLARTEANSLRSKFKDWKKFQSGLPSKAAIFQLEQSKDYRSEDPSS